MFRYIGLVVGWMIGLVMLLICLVIIFICMLLVGCVIGMCLGVNFWYFGLVILLCVGRFIYSWKLCIWLDFCLGIFECIKLCLVVIYCMLLGVSSFLLLWLFLCCMCLLSI